MQTPIRWWLFVVCAVCVCATSAFCANGDGDSKPAVGYISCTKNKLTIPTFDNDCPGKASGEIACGERVEVVSREGAFFKIAAKDRIVYVSAAMVSSSPKKFVPISADVPTTQSNCMATLMAERAKAPDKQRPMALSTPQPEFSDEARRDKVQGTVTLSMTVGVDGIPRDIHVEHSLGHGLDEKAIEAASRWRFAPALQDGKPVEAKVSVEFGFTIYLGK